MRSGFSVQLFGENGDIFPVDMHLLLESLGVSTVYSANLGQEQAIPEISVMGLGGRLTLTDLQARRAWLADNGAASLALLSSDDPSNVAMAAAIQCDDTLIWPVDEHELATRLNDLHTLANYRLEWRLRKRLFEHFAKDEGIEPGPPGLEIVSVLLVGSLGTSAGRLAEMLQPAEIAFAPHAQAVVNHLEKTEFDLILADAGFLNSSDCAIDWQTSAPPSHAKRVVVGEPAQFGSNLHGSGAMSHWFDRCLPIDLASDQLRQRLRLLRRLAVIGRQLSKPPTMEAFGHRPRSGFERGSSLSFGHMLQSIIDNETGCLNAGFARAYLQFRHEEAGRSFQILDVSLSDLAGLIKELGFAGLSRYFLELANALRLNLRCDDLLCHMGEGNFRVILQCCSEVQVGQIASRLIKVSHGRLRKNRASDEAARQQEIDLSVT